MNIERHRRRRGWSLGLLGSALFALVAILVHRKGNAVSSHTFLYCRSILTLTVIGLLAPSGLRRYFSRSSAREWSVACFGACAILIYFVNLQRTKAGIATTLHNVAPILVALASPFLLRVTFRWYALLGAVFAASGAACISVSDVTGFDVTIVTVGLLGALAGAGSYIAMKEATKSASAMSVIWVTSLVLLAGCFILGVPKLSAFTDNWAFLLLMSTFALVSQLLTVRSYYYIDAVSASVLTVTPVLWTVLYDLAIGDLRMGVTTFGGMAAIVAGMVLTGRSQYSVAQQVRNPS